MWRSGLVSCLQNHREDGNKPLVLTDSFVDWQNVTANHRMNDAVFTEDSQQVVTGRFMYGPLDMVTLAGEKVNL